MTGWPLRVPKLPTPAPAPPALRKKVLQLEQMQPIIGPGKVSGKSGSCLTATWVLVSIFVKLDIFEFLKSN